MQNVTEPIGYIKNPYKSKFGVPRQSGLADTSAVIEMLPEYGVAEAFRGLEEFSHIWLLWEFSNCNRDGWTPTVRPPKLGGNKRVGVFATRSPYRPNAIGLSCVELNRIEYKDGTVLLHITGADLMDGTPIYDIKPYLPYTDCRPEAGGGFTDQLEHKLLDVVFECEHNMADDIKSQLIQALSQDPRPSYHEDVDRVYGMDFDIYNVRFTVSGNRVSVVEVREIS
jgi:tRNA-Thr(GGU) m(6)t(6)A37 methyltransferase TsaA